MKKILLAALLCVTPSLAFSATCPSVDEVMRSLRTEPNGLVKLNAQDGLSGTWYSDASMPSHKVVPSLELDSFVLSFIRTVKTIGKAEQFSCFYSFKKDYSGPRPANGLYIIDLKGDSPNKDIFSYMGKPIDVGQCQGSTVESCTFHRYERMEQIKTK